MMLRFHSLLPLACLAIAGCGGGSSNTADARVSACDVIYMEPVLALTGATHSVTGAPIQEVTVAAVAIGGRLIDSRFLIADASNVTLVGSDLSCRLPCAFSHLEGEYEFTVKSPGFLDKSVSVPVRYSRAVVGCSTTYSGSTAISIQLTPR